MRQPFPRASQSNLRVFTACLLSFLLLMAPLVPVSAAIKSDTAPPNALAHKNAPREKARSGAQASTTQPAYSLNFLNAFAPAPVPGPLTATKDDALLTDVDGDGKADPGVDVIGYTVQITNTGTNDATGVNFSDNIDPNTTLVGGSLNVSPLATDDTYSAVANTLLEVGPVTTPSAAPKLTVTGSLFGNDTEYLGDTFTLKAVQAVNFTSGDTVATTTNGGTVTVEPDGNFSYLPPVGSTTTDTFTYTITDDGADNNLGTTADNLTGVGTVTINFPVTTKVWYVDNNYGGNPASDGRSTRPFQSLAAVTGATGPDATNDIIYVASSASNYTGGITLLNNQLLTGGGVALVVNSNTLKAAGTTPTITNVGGTGVTLASGNTLSGFNVGDTAIDISGNNFGTLTVSSVALNGNGRPLNLTTGALSATFTSISSSAAPGGQGINIAGATGTMTVTGGTSITNPGTQCILVGTTTANIDFGNTTCSGGSDGVSFQNNSGGTRTIGTLNVSGGTGSAFLHGAGGGNVTVSGAASLSSGGNPVDIQNQAASTTVSFSSGATLAKTTAGGAGLNMINDNGTVTFSALTIGTSGARFGSPAVVITGGAGPTFSTGTTNLGAVSIFTNNQSGISSTNDNGTLNVTSGTVDVNAASAVAIDGPAGISTLGITLGTVNSTGGTNNVLLSEVGGSINLQAGALSGATAAAFSVNGSSATVTCAASITNSTGGINLTSNTGSTITFSGGMNITTAATTAFNATGGGTVNATQNNTTILNILSSTSGTALNVDNTTIGASGLTFRSISAGNNTAAADPNTGIVLNATGAGGLTVVGNGSAGTGGTLQNINNNGVLLNNANNISLSWMNLTSANLADGGSGAGGGTCALDNLSTCNGAIEMNTVTNVTLSRVVINGAEEQGIVGSTVTGFNMSNSSVTNAGDEAAENGVYFRGLFGTVSVTNNTFTGSAFYNFGVLNESGATTLNMTVTGNTFSNNSSIGGDGLGIDTRGGTTSVVNVSNNTFTANKDDHFNFVSSSNAVVNLTFATNTLTGGHGSPTGQGIAVRVGGNFSGTFTFDINGNNVNGAIPTAINTGFGSTTGTGLLRGTIRNNIVGTTGVNLSGSAQGSCILAETNGTGTGTYNVLITGNTLKRCFDKGIDLLGSRDGSNNLNATVTSNNVNELVDVNSRWAIRLETGSSLLNETGTVCADIASNTLFAQTIIDEMSVRARSPVTLRFPGYTGGTTDNTALQNYLTGRNPAGGSATATNSSGATFNNTVPAGSACAQPPLPSLPPVPPPLSGRNEGVNQRSDVAQTVKASASSDEVFTSHNSKQARKTTARKIVEPTAFDISGLQLYKSINKLIDSRSLVRPRVSATTKRTAHAAHSTALATPAPPSGENVSVNIGTLPGGTPGKTLTIKFAVTVDNPFNGMSQSVSNQGNITSGNAGSVNTDDPGTGTVGDPTITPVDAIQITIGDVSVAEGAVGFRTMSFRVNLSNPAGPSGVSVHYQTQDNSATSPADYTAVPDTVLNISSGQTFGTINVQVKGDTTFEGNQNFFVNLSTPTGGSLVDSQAIGTIADDEPMLGDFDGDGLTDLGLWGADNSWRALLSATNTISTPLTWGDANAPTNDVAVPGDYDGDNKTDVAVYRPGDGNWYVFQSSTNSPVILNWGGAPGDRPITGDFDADGKTDLAVFRPSDNNWYIKNSSNGSLSIYNWGTGTDKLVPADYDGDGKTDVAVFRPSDGNWYVLRSDGGGSIIQQWGVGTDKLVPGDYDGDGKTDFAVYRPSDNNWYVRNSATGTTTIRNWGASSDLPLTGDFDGDGRTEFAVWRPLEGNWYLLKSSDGATVVVNIGAAGDRPVPQIHLPQ